MTKEEAFARKMTHEEAFEILRDTPIDIRSTREDDILTLYATAQMIALDCIEKQIPKKPTNICIRCGFVVEGLCSTCGSAVLPEHKYCSNCGQTIDWSK